MKNTNAYLARANKLQDSGLFGKVNHKVFDLGKMAHVQHWFFKELKLKPLAHGVSGEPSTGKLFQAAYKDVPEVAIFKRYKQLLHLKRSFIVPFYKKVTESSDGMIDSRIRPSYGFASVVTGRSNSYKPSLQQIPSRTPETKYLKRGFSAGSIDPSAHKILIKLDFNTHEIRMWADTSLDKALGNQFLKARAKRIEYMKTNNPDLPAKIKLMDLHRINVGLFLEVDIATMDPAILEAERDLIKAVVFGSIYGRSVRSIARATKRSEEDIENALSKFFTIYKKGGDWLESMKEFAQEHLWSYSIIGRRRNLYGYLTGIPRIIAANSRQAANSPIQGLGADVAHLANRVFTLEWLKVCKKQGWMESYGTKLPNCIEVMVHDSSRTAANLAQACACMQVLNWSYTIGVEKVLSKVFGMPMVCPLEIEFEIGPSEAHMKKWDWSFKSLKKILMDSLDTAQAEGIYKVTKADREDIWANWYKSDLRKEMDTTYPWFT